MIKFSDISKYILYPKKIVENGQFEMFRPFLKEVYSQNFQLIALKFFCILPQDTDNL